MSTASEKLKEHGGHIELTAFVGNPSTTIDIAFWPQIVAVIEAAERAGAGTTEPFASLRAALAALDEALA